MKKIIKQGESNSMNLDTDDEILMLQASNLQKRKSQKQLVKNIEMSKIQDEKPIKVMDYDDEFRSHLHELSESWRIQYQKEKRF